ncbi:MAG: DUF262 domain-containing protein [Myxococcota bacterium]
MDDLTGKFLDFYDESHARQEVGEYGHYFLGSIVISLKQGKRFIVDGQQRLTTLTLNAVEGMRERRKCQQILYGVYFLYPRVRLFAGQGFVWAQRGAHGWRFSRG